MATAVLMVAGMLLGSWTPLPVSASTTSTATGLRISVTPSITFGDYARVDGRLVSAATGGPIGGQLVAVYGRRVGTPTWTLLAGLTTDPAGLIHYARIIGGDAEFTLRFAGSTSLTAAASPNATVRVAPIPTTLRISATPTTISLGQATTVGGRLVSTATGAYQAGEPLTVYGRRLGTTTWAALARLSADSSGLIQYTRYIGGSAEFQLVFPGSAIRSPSTSPVIRVYVNTPGHTIYVSPGGPSLQSVIDKVVPGDTIAMHAGTYTGQINITRSGTPSAPITIRPAGDGPVTVTSSFAKPECNATSPTVFRTFKILGGADYWTISGLRIINGVWMSGLNGSVPVTWLKNHFRSGDWHSRRALPGRGSYNPTAARGIYPALSAAVRAPLDPVEGVRILNNDISGRGVQIILARDGEVGGNRIHDIDCGIGPAVWVNSYSDFWRVHDNTVSNVAESTYRHYMQEGIRLGSASAYNVVENNTVTDLPGDGRAVTTDIDASFNTFQHNTVARVQMGFNDQASGWYNKWLYNTAESLRGPGFAFRGVDAKFSAPSLNSSTYRALVQCNKIIGGGSMSAGALIETTFVNNYFANLGLSTHLQAYWTQYGNTWNGSHALPPESPPQPAPGAC